MTSHSDVDRPNDERAPNGPDATSQPGDANLGPAQASLPADVSDASVPKTEDNRRPLGPAVFGKYAFFITAVPYIFYLIFLGGADYIEGVRAHSTVKTQTLERVQPAIRSVQLWLKANVGDQVGKEEKLWNDWNMEAISAAIDPNLEKEVDPEKLAELLVPLLETLDPEFPEKDNLRRQLVILKDMKIYEKQHKLREVQSLSVRDSGDLFQEGSFEIDSSRLVANSATSSDWFPPNQTWYPATYTLTIVGSTLLMLIVFRGYFRTPFRVSVWSVIIGVGGFAAWVGLAVLDHRFLHLGETISPSARAAFNPFQELKDNSTWMWQFVAIRFFGLCLVVPFVEEFFLRGWLMRYIDDPDWDYIPIGENGKLAIFGAVGYGFLTHMMEPLSAVVWFGMVTWMFLKTKSIWDCVFAHMITNLLLGIFVVCTGSWYLW